MMRSKRLWLIIVFGLVAVCSWAQGDNTGMGGRDEGVASILERLNIMKQKNEAFNIFLNTSMAYEEQFGHDVNNGFKGRQMRFEARGFLDEHWSYRFRLKLNNVWQKDADGFSNNLNIMMVSYQVNKRLRLKLGKQGLGMGGFEYDTNAIQVLDYSDFNDNLSTSLIGVQVAYDVSRGQEIQFEITNSNNESLEVAYPGADLEKARHPIALTVNWTGNRLWNKLENHWSYTYMHEASGVSNRFLMLGSRLTLDKLQCYLDYYQAWEDIDRHGVVSADAAAADITKPVGDGEVSSVATLRNVRYQSVVGYCQYQFSPHWAGFVKGFAERASAPDISALNDYRRNYGYQVALQWIPDLTQDARLSLAYVGKTTRYDEATGLQNHCSNRVELSLIYRIKIF